MAGINYFGNPASGLPTPQKDKKIAQPNQVRVNTQTPEVPKVTDPNVGNAVDGTNQAGNYAKRNVGYVDAKPTQQQAESTGWTISNKGDTGPGTGAAQQGQASQGSTPKAFPQFQEFTYPSATGTGGNSDAMKQAIMAATGGATGLDGLLGAGGSPGQMQQKADIGLTSLYGGQGESLPTLTGAGQAGGTDYLDLIRQMTEPNTEALAGDKNMISDMVEGAANETANQLNSGSKPADNGSLGQAPSTDKEAALVGENAALDPFVKSTINKDLDNALLGTNSSVWTDTFNKGKSDIYAQGAQDQNTMAGELAARGLGSSGAFTQGTLENQANVRSQISDLLLKTKQQDVDTQLTKLQSLLSFKGQQLSDETKRDLANQVAELEQQKLNLQGEQQQFDQQQAAMEGIQAMSYNLTQLGMSQEEARNMIDQTIQAMKADGVPLTAENIWNYYLNNSTSGEISGSPENFWDQYLK